ncbi:MAG TPA: hypothetical protein VLN61_06815, partial [Pseudolabrys sp.]|nr:hypothetical protein [Pseudolabrys sp.]
MDGIWSEHSARIPQTFGLARNTNLAWLRGRPFGIVAAVILLAIVGGNTTSLIHFFSDGRGHYSQAVSRMVKNEWIIYGSDHDFRTPMVV